MAWAALPVIAIVVALSTPPAFAQAQEGWTSYTNARFGAKADYPARRFSVRDRPPDNGDGQTFRTPDGRAELTIYGAHNVQQDTPQSYVENYVNHAGISLKRITARFFVVSGTRDGKIFYQRCNFPTARDGIVHCFNLTYPAGEKDWDAIVTRIGSSLSAGRNR